MDRPTAQGEGFGLRRNYKRLRVTKTCYLKDHRMVGTQPISPKLIWQTILGGQVYSEVAGFWPGAITYTDLIEQVLSQLMLLS